MKLIVGLGNPGEQYRKTRHNAGRFLLESLAAHLKVRFQKSKIAEYTAAIVDSKDEKTILAYPDCFMNVSGPVVKKLVDDFSIDFKKDFLILVDDVALTLGRLRLKSKGSDGGHNGLKSVQEALGSLEYARLKLGIGPSDATAIPFLRDYVLSEFPSDERKALEEMVKRGLKACTVWLEQPIEKAMNAVNVYK